MPDPTPKKKLPLELDSLARAFTEEAIRQISGVLSNDPDSAKRLQAAVILLDRGWGRPKEIKDLKVSGEVRVILRRMLDDDVEGESE